MATNPQAAPMQLPPPYKSLVPLSSEVHAKFEMAVNRTSMEFAREMHAIPIAVDEIRDAQRFYPIVFSAGEQCMPLALVGLSEGQNAYIDADGNWRKGCYVPAYLRRYPFVLARLRQGTDEMTLCFDDSYADVGEGKGSPLFENGATTEITKNILAFCEQYEQAMARTRNFIDELTKGEFLMEGEVTIQQEGMEKPAVYRGFKMIAEEKIKNLRGDQARKLVQNGMLPVMYLHLISLSLIRELYAEINPPKAA